MIGESRIGYRSTDPVIGCIACGVSYVKAYPGEPIDVDAEWHTVIGELSEAVGLPMSEGPGGVPTDSTEGDLYGTTGSSPLSVWYSVGESGTMRIDSRNAGCGESELESKVLGN